MTRDRSDTKIAPRADVDLKALTEAFRRFTESTDALEKAYQLLDAHARELSEELARKNHELALANEYLDSILESMSDGVVAVDNAGCITRFNRAAGVVLEYEAAEVVGHPFGEIFAREFSVSPRSPVLELRAKSGRRVPVSDRDAPIRDRSGRRVGYVKVFQDLTEIETLREQVRKMDRLAAIGEMAATVAHEIRNPLGAVRGFAALLQRDTPPDDPRARLIEKILAGTRNLDRVITELLEYTRPVDLRLRPISCGELAEAALACVDLGGKSIAVIDETPGDVRVLADPDKMRQVLLNLLINAVQSIQDTGEIRLLVQEEDAHFAVIAVQDTGCGIPPEHRDKVFFPFYTTKEKGSGLGLAVAAKIVDAHAGSIALETQPGAGSIFRIRLPRAE